MNIQAIPYSRWADTARTMHMLLQMLGKVKLRRNAPQPEWNHALLYPTPSGFTTGLVPHDGYGFAVTMDIAAGRVDALCTSGRSSGFSLTGTHSVSELYARFGRMLEGIGHATPINAEPQEMPTKTPFGEQTGRHAWDGDAARAYFQNALFAHRALGQFAAPYRGKKISPSLFWGTFDMTTVLFSGVEKPFGGSGLIERVAFDEQFVEFGFWPGDDAVDDPSFFALPYPFLEKDLSGEAVRPAAAWYSPEKKEYFLKLKDIASEKDPAAVLNDFLWDAFHAVTRAEGWPNLSWLTKPLAL